MPLPPVTGAPPYSRSTSAFDGASADDLTPVGLLSLDAGGGDGRPSAVELFAAAEEADPWPAPRAASLEPCHSSSDEEEEDEAEDGAAGEDSSPAHISMEVDTSDPWAEASPAGEAPQVAMDTNLWEAAPASSAAPAAAQWADFGSATASATAEQQSSGEAKR